MVGGEKEGVMVDGEWSRAAVIFVRLVLVTCTRGKAKTNESKLEPIYLKEHALLIKLNLLLLLLTVSA